MKYFGPYNLVKSLTFYYLKIGNVIWHERPKLGLLLKFYQSKKTHDLSSRASARMLNFDDLIDCPNVQSNEAGGEVHYSYLVKSYSQKILPIKHDQKALLKKSQLTFNPHEVFQIKVIGNFETKYSKIFHGSETAVKNVALIENIMRKMVLELKNNSNIIEKIEVNHTHPSAQLKLIFHDKTQYLLNPLSQSDVRVGEYLSRFVDCPVAINAITPNDFYFNYEFRRAA